MVSVDCDSAKVVIFIHKSAQSVEKKQDLYRLMVIVWLDDGEEKDATLLKSYTFL